MRHMTLTNLKNRIMWSLNRCSKCFDEIQHPFIIKILNEVGTEGTYLKIKWRQGYDQPIANIIHNVKNLKPFPLRLGIRQRCPLSPLLFNIETGSPNHSNQIWKRNKSKLKKKWSCHYL